MTQLDPEVRRQRLATGFKWGLGLLVAAVISPVIYLAITGLVGLVIAGVIGFTAIQLAPVFAFKLANIRMKMIVGEARDNPIETMKNLYVEKATELETADNNIVEFETEIGNFHDKIDKFKDRYPTETESYEELEARMRDALTDMKSQQKLARRDLKDFSLQIDKAEAILAMALAAQNVTRLSKSAEAQVFANIKEKVAFDSVQSQLNKSFASLNMALSKRESAMAALPAPTPDTDTTSTRAKVRIAK